MGWTPLSASTLGGDWRVGLLWQIPRGMFIVHRSHDSPNRSLNVNVKVISYLLSTAYKLTCSPLHVWLATPAKTVLERATQ